MDGVDPSPESYRPVGGATGRGTGGGIGGGPDWLQDDIGGGGGGSSTKGEEGTVLGGVDDDTTLGVMGVACNAVARASLKAFQSNLRLS